MQQPTIGQGMPQAPMQTNFLAGYQQTQATTVQHPNQARGISSATGAVQKTTANFQNTPQNLIQNQAMALPGTYPHQG